MEESIPTSVLREQNKSTSKTAERLFDQQGLKILHLNIHYFYPKFDEIKLLMSDNSDIDIAGFCETFLSDNFLENGFILQNYQIFRKDRPTNGGSLLLYVKNCFPCVRRLDLECNELEIVWVEVCMSKQRPFLQGYVYRPPSAPKSWTENYMNILEKVVCLNIETIITGDFNINLLSQNSQSDNWMNINRAFNLTQLVTEPTRITSVSQTLIDHVYTNCPVHIKCISVPKLSLSDHFPVCITRKTAKTSEGPLHKLITYKSNKNFNKREFLSDLESQPWNTLEIFDDPNDALDLFSKHFLDTLNRHAPLKTKRVKLTNQPDWYNEDIKEAMKQRDQLKKTGDQEAYKHWRNKVKKLIRQAKKSFFTETINNNLTKNPKLLWKNLKDLSGKSNSYQTNYIHDENGQPITDSEKAANTFNDYFLSIFYFNR